MKFQSKYKEKVEKGIIVIGGAVFRLKMLGNVNKRGARVGQLLYLRDRRALHITGLFTLFEGIYTGDVVKDNVKHNFVLRIVNDYIYFTDNFLDALKIGGYISDKVKYEAT